MRQRPSEDGAGNIKKPPGKPGGGRKSSSLMAAWQTAFLKVDP